MSIVTSPSRAAILRGLWRRSPVWRFFALAAPGLTIVFLAFPPTVRPPPVADRTSSEPASYAPVEPAKAEIAPVAAKDAPQASQASSPPAAPARASGMSASPPAPPAPPIAPVTNAAPTAAQLSMVTAGAATPANGTGLDGAMVGPLYSSSITSTGFTIPLPTGRWAVLSRTTLKGPKASGMAYYLGKIERKRLVGAVKIFALRGNGPETPNFPEAKACTNPNDLSYLHVEGDLAPLEHQACWLVHGYFAAGLSYWADRAVKMNEPDRAAGGDLAAKGVSFPQDLVEVRFTQSDKHEMLEVDYLFSPEAEGIISQTAPSAADSDWTAVNVKRYPEKVAYIAKMQAWGEAFWPRFKDAFSKGAGVPAT